jgi:hypothetical protein
MLRGAGAGAGTVLTPGVRSKGDGVSACVNHHCAGPFTDPFPEVSPLIALGRRLVYSLRRSDTEVEWCVEAWAGSPRFFFHQAFPLLEGRTGLSDNRVDQEGW